MSIYDSLDQILNYAIQSDNEFESGIDSVQIATARIEQGNLYKMLIEQDIFAGVQANPEVVNKVRSELIQFATIRLEMLLGIRQINKENRPSSGMSLEEDEVVILKGLIAKIKEKEGLLSSPESAQPQIQSKGVGQLKPLQAPPQQNAASAATTPTFSPSTPPSKKKANSESVKKNEPAQESAQPSTQSSTKNDSDSELGKKKITIQSLKKRRDEILKRVVERDNEWTDEEANEFRQISEQIQELSKQRPYAPLYTPQPSVDEENQISVYRADLLNKNLHTILSRREN